MGGLTFVEEGMGGSLRGKAGRAGGEKRGEICDWCVKQLKTFFIKK